MSKIYLAHDTYPEIFDPMTSEWSSWPTSNVVHGYYGCLLSWRDSLIFLGGYNARKVVEIFDVSSQTWKILDSSAPIDIYKSACVVLPNDEILVAGSSGDGRRSFIYNVTANKWRRGGDSIFSKKGSSLVVLGSRVFAVGGGYYPEVVEEFDLSSETWIVVDTPILFPRRFHSMISVPAELFSHLAGGCQGVE